MTLNTVAVAPMPRANERIDTTAKPGAMRNCRTTCRRSIERLTNGAISIVSYSRQRYPRLACAFQMISTSLLDADQLPNLRVLHGCDGAICEVPGGNRLGMDVLPNNVYF